MSKPKPVRGAGDATERERPWYRDGLRFACQRCGHCCTGGPGTVLLSDAEIETLARRLELADVEFRAIYTRTLRGGDVTLRERPNGECRLWGRERGCTVYGDRPRQCRSWPFWSSVVHSAERWAEEAESCPGMNRGPVHDEVSIGVTAGSDGTLGNAKRRR